MRQPAAAILFLAVCTAALGAEAPQVTRQATAEDWIASASSEWGPGYGASAAADGIAHENGNYWQTVQGKDKGAWWQVDLGALVPVRGVKIVWARYEDNVHCPPASVVIQTSATGKEGSWKDARRIAMNDLPRDGSAYNPDRAWSYAMAEPTPARYVRLVFPEGGQPGARYPGYLCLGEVEVQAPGVAPQIVAIEGRFGRADVNVGRPSMARLVLRGSAGLERESLLATHGRYPWARGGYTYVVAEDGRRYESRWTRPEKVEQSPPGAPSELRITGVKIASGADEPPVAREDWTLSATADGSLVWKIVRRWERDCTAVLSGSPALFFSFDARNKKNSTTSTIWYDPLYLTAGPDAAYALVRDPRKISENHLQVVRDRDTWAIYKLWTNWHAACDLRLDVTGGHLYRRGSYAWLSEAGAVVGAEPKRVCRQGQIEEISLSIRGVEKAATGYQLSISLPDKLTEASLKDFYGSVLNGGAVNDQKGFDFGNETDGWYYAGSCWMYGAALAAGVPAAAPVSARPYDPARAFREHLAHVLSTLDDQGRARFGYNQGGQWVDDNLHTIQGTRSYLLHTGDLPLVRQHLPALERMLGYFIQRQNAQGLFKLDDTGAHWYYDAITTGGINGYYNAFFYKAAADLAEMEEAAGRTDRARQYRELAASIKAAFNRVFWKDDLPGGPRYVDFFDAQGREATYFCDLCQWPPIAVGIASPEQARKIVATADARIAELEKQNGYRGCAGLSALWPVPPHLNPHSWQTFGRYMNGGSLLCQTYWEIVARARAGDAAGAARRLRGFARRAAETSWAGDNAADIQAEMLGGDGEPYLADMVAATAAAVHGVLGIEPTWQELKVTPHLPPDWPRAEADVLYKGRLHHVTIERNKVRVEPRGVRVDLPLSWTMDWNLKNTDAGPATVSQIDFTGAYQSEVVLARGATEGTWQSPIHDWTVPARLSEITIAIDLHGGSATATIETSDDGFKTVRSQFQIRLRDGGHSYPSQPADGRHVRVRIELARPALDSPSPVFDGFRLTAAPR